MRPIPSPRSGASANDRKFGVQQTEPPCLGDAVDPFSGSFGPGASGSRILIVDDDAEMRNLVSRMVECFGYEACSAASGEAALQQLKGGGIEVVITDYKMPWMNGAQLTVKIRRRYLGLPVILMTGNYGLYLDDPLRSRGLFAGVLEKPFNLSSLRKTIDATGVALRRSRVTA